MLAITSRLLGKVVASWIVSALCAGYVAGGCQSWCPRLLMELLFSYIAQHSLYECGQFWIRKRLKGCCEGLNYFALLSVDQTFAYMNKLGIRTIKISISHNNCKRQLSLLILSLFHNKIYKILYSTKAHLCFTLHSYF